MTANWFQEAEFARHFILLALSRLLGKFKDVSDEIEGSANIDIKDSVMRISGTAGFLFVVLGAFAVAGGNLEWLIHWGEIIIVFSSVFFGLLSTFRADFLAYIPKALKACVVKPKPNADDCEISEYGRRYAVAGGGLGRIARNHQHICHSRQP